jgi:hypothetical protein
MECGHRFHVLFRTSQITAIRVGIGIDRVGQWAPQGGHPLDIYGRACGVNGDPVDFEILEEVG